MIKAVIFDCFGVLYPDTLSLVSSNFIDENDDSSKQQINSIRLRSDKGMISRDEFWDEVANTLKIHRDTLNNELQKVQGVDKALLSYIEFIKANYKTALLSSVGKEFLERIFDDNHPQSNYFDTVIASGDVGFIKPNLQAYTYTARQLGVEPFECVMIDDNVDNCRGAEEAGMRAIHYKDFSSMKTQLEQIISA